MVLFRSYELCVTSFNERFNSAPSHNEDVASSHLKVGIGALDIDRFIRVLQCSHEYRFVKVWRLYHADATSCIIQSLQRCRELG